jgi:hypothetical protein
MAVGWLVFQTKPALPPSMAVGWLVFQTKPALPPSMAVGWRVFQTKPALPPSMAVGWLVLESLCTPCTLRFFVWRCPVFTESACEKTIIFIKYHIVNDLHI